MTPRERATFKQNNPSAQKLQGQLAVEQQKGKNKLADTAAQGQNKVVQTLVEKAAEHNESVTPLEEGFGRAERLSDEKQFQAGMAE